MSELKLSVVIPTYHREQQVVGAIRSVLSEGIDSMEVIVVDDAPERSARVAVMGVEDPRVTYVAMPTPTGGCPAAVRNWALERVQGQYTYFLDDDDRAVSGGVRGLLAALEARPRAGVAIGRVLATGPDPDAAREYTRHFDWAARTAKRLAFSSWLTVGVVMFRRTLIINSCCMIRTALARELGGYDTRIPVYEDVEFFTRAIHRGGHVFVDVPVLLYSTGLQSIIHDLRGDVAIVHESYTMMHDKHRRRSLLGYRVLQVVSRLLPIGAPMHDPPVAVAPPQPADVASVP